LLLSRLAVGWPSAAAVTQARAASTRDSRLVRIRIRPASSASRRPAHPSDNRV